MKHGIIIQSQAHVRKLEARIADLTLANTNANKLIAQAADEAAALTERIKKTEQHCLEAIAQDRDIRAEALRSQLAAKDVRIEQLQAAVNELNSEVARLSKTLSLVETDLDTESFKKCVML